MWQFIPETGKRYGLKIGPLSAFRKPDPIDDRHQWEKATDAADEVAKREDSAPGTTFRLMRACVALGLLTADREDRFHGTPLLATLRKDAPGSLRGLALATTLPAQWLIWNEFTASVRSGLGRYEVCDLEGLQKSHS